MTLTHPNHSGSLSSLKRIEGQIRGIQRMIEDQRYCVDILTQLSAVNNAVRSVQDKILSSHIEGCFSQAFVNGTSKDQIKKTEEVIRLLKTFRK